MGRSRIGKRPERTETRRAPGAGTGKVKTAGAEFERKGCNNQARIRADAASLRLGDLINLGASGADDCCLPRAE